MNYTKTEHIKKGKHELSWPKKILTKLISFVKASFVVSLKKSDFEFDVANTYKRRIRTTASNICMKAQTHPIHHWQLLFE